MERIARICFGILVSLTAISSSSTAQEIGPLGRLFNYWDSATDVVVDGNYAYVATGISGLQVVDISDPPNPRVVGVFDDFNDKVTQVFLVEDLVYAATYNTVSIFDISRAPIIRKVRDVWVWSFYGTIDIKGTVMLAAGEEPGMLGNRLTLFDISDPSNPAITDTLHLENNTVSDIDVQDNYAFVASDIILTIDLSDVENMRIVGRYPRQAVQIITNGDYAYIASGLFGVFSILDPSNIELDHWVWETNGSNDMKIVGNMLFISGSRRLTCFDLSEPQNPREVSSVRMLTDYARFYPALPLIVATNETNGISVFDYSEPEHPDSIGAFNSVGEVKEVRLIDRFTYTCTNNVGFQIINSSDPLHPEFVKLLPLQGYLRHFEIQNNIAYVASTRNGFYLIDVTNPSEARVIANYDPDEARVSNLAINGESLYSFSGGFRILNIVDPDSIYQTGECGWAFNSDELECSVQEFYIFFVTRSSNDNFGVIDISNSEAPQVVFSDSLQLSPFSDLSDIVIKDGIAFISGLFDGLLVYDITDPLHPEELARIERDIYGLDHMTVEGDYLIGASRYYGISVYDISNPVVPRLVRQFEDCYNLKSISVDGNIAAVAQSTSLRFYNLDGERSVPIFEEEIPFTDGLISAYPNPFNGVTNIRVNLPSNTPLQLVLFDANGRSHWREKLAPGARSLMLDGNSLPSGSFYLQAVNGSVSQTLPIIHLK